MAQNNWGEIKGKLTYKNKFPVFLSNKSPTRQHQEGCSKVWVPQQQKSDHFWGCSRTWRMEQLRDLDQMISNLLAV